MPNRARDWLQQAQRDLEHAAEARQNGKHEWACFAAQQSAEKAVKALHLHCGQEAWGHVIVDLLEDLPDHVAASAEMVEKARVLDNFYIPSRYPNSHPTGAPFQHYGPLQSQQAVDYAREVLEFARAQMA
jgi:HEPN domain-containing protein